MAELFKVNAPVRKPLFEGVQGENEARSIQFDITPWVEELGDGAVTATAKRSQDSQPYPVTVTKDGNTVTWKPTSTDTAFAGVGSFQLEYTVDSVLAKTCIWSTMVAPSLDPAGDPPDPYDNWLAEMRQVAADALQSEQNAEDSAEDAEAWAVGQRGGVDVPSTDPTYHNNSKYWAEQSAANQYGAYIVKSASGDIASFNDGADNVPMKSVQVTITPKQAGSGDPSPSNVRPITGWTDANVYVTAFNQWDEEWENGSLEGAGNPVANANCIRSKNYCGCLGGTSYYLNCTTYSGLYYVKILWFDSEKNYISSVYCNGLITTSPANARYFKLSTQSVSYIYGGTYNHDICFNFSDPSKNGTYEPYTGHTTPVPLGQTVYGGEVDVVSGNGGSGWLIDMGDLDWVKSSSPARFEFNNLSGVVVPSSNLVPAEIMCDTYKTVDVDTITTDFAIAMNTNGGLRVYDSAKQSMTRIQFREAMAGHKLYVKLVNPTPFTITPVEVASLLGTNNMWADCGDIAVEYRADPTLAYNELANVIVSLGGNL